MIIKISLVLILFFCCASLWYVLKSNERYFFYKILSLYLILFLIQWFHVLLFEFFVPQIHYMVTAASYPLLYGPLFYFLILRLQNKTLKTYIWLVHLIPFFLFYLLFFIFLFNDELRMYYQASDVTILDKAVPLSFLGYVAVSIFQKKKFIGKPAFTEIKEFVITMGVFLVFLALFFYVVRVTGGNHMYEARLVVYFSMLSMLIYIFVFLVRKKEKINNRNMEKSSSDSIKASNKTKYKKVKITEEQLDEYEQKLYRIMNERKVFLDTGLSVDKLAKEIKIPSYHLTQLFSSRIGKNFNQFVNTYRVNFACVILDSTEDVKIDTLISKCGFNSKTSFNRHFKMIKGVSPSEYSSQRSNNSIS